MSQGEYPWPEEVKEAFLEKVEEGIANTGKLMEEFMHFGSWHDGEPE